MKELRLPGSRGELTGANEGEPKVLWETGNVKSVPLGPFEIDRAIGAGAMAEVWEGRHVQTGVPVAVKVMIGSGMSDPTFLDAFRKEVRAVARLDHPNIVAILDHGQITERIKGTPTLRFGCPYIVMELATGGTLAQCPPSSWTQLRTHLNDLLLALAHAHAHGLVHCDIKAGNVLLAGSGDVRSGLKLSDFGIAFAPDDVGEHSLGGTPAYMAPEQVLGHWRDYGPWTDLYALGCLSFRMVTGRTPFSGKHPMAQAHAQIEKPFPPMLSRFPVPEGLEDWISALSRKKPRERFQSAAEALAALNLLLETPPAAVDWRESSVAPRSKDLLGAGLSLYGLRRPPLLGREQVQEALWRSLETCAETDEVGVVVLDGAAGVGKTRLAEWLAIRATELGRARAAFVSHNAVPEEGDGLAGVIERHLTCQGLVGDNLLMRISAVVDSAIQPSVLPILALLERDAEAVVSSDERYATAQRVLRGASTLPLILVVDDGHFGADTLRFARHLLQRAQQSAVLVVIAVREDELADRQEESALVAALRKSARTRSIAVDPLRPDDAAELSRSLLGFEGDVAGQLQLRAAGNPMFIVEVIRDWVARGALEMGPTGFRLASPGDALLPDTLHEVWNRRATRALEGYSKDAVQAVALAAALGLNVQMKEWAACCETAGFEVPHGLVDGLLEQRLAVIGSEGSWSFRNAMFRETILRSVSDREGLTELHRVCASVLSDGDSPGRLGWHRLQAGDAEGAIAPLNAALHGKNATHALSEKLRLLRLYDRAISATGCDRDSMERIVSETWHGHFARASAQFASAIEHFDRVLEWCEERAEPDIELNAAEHRGLISRATGDHPGALRFLDRARDIAAGLGQDLRCAGIDIRRAMLLSDMGQNEEAYAQAVAVLPILEADVKGFAIGNGHNGAAVIAIRARNFENARHHAMEARDAFRAVGHRTGEADALNVLGEIARFRGDLTTAESLYRQAVRTNRASESGYSVIFELNLSLTLIAREDWLNARRHLEACLQALRDQGRPGFCAGTHCFLLHCAAALDDWEAWDEHERQATELFEVVSIADHDFATALDHAGILAVAAGEMGRSRAAFALAAYQWERLGDAEAAQQSRAKAL